MVNITLSVPVDLKKKMDEHQEIKWSAVVRSIIEERLSLMDELDRIAESSHLEEKDVEELTMRFNDGLRKRMDASFDETNRRR